jgi:hypothetical protein
MNVTKVMLAAFPVFTTAHCASPQAQSTKPWAPATYHGLVMGESTRADVLSILGNAKWAGKEPDTGIPIMSFDVSYPVPGELEVYLTNGILDSMTLNLNEKMARKNIIHLLGPNYTIVRYATDECLSEGGSAPIYENLSGPIKYLEYRDRGLAAALDYEDDDKVEAIVFYVQGVRPHPLSLRNTGQEKIAQAHLRATGRLLLWVDFGQKNRPRRNSSPRRRLRYTR